MLEAAFIEARHAHKVKAVGQAAGNVVRERRPVVGEPGRHYFPIISEVAAVSPDDC